MNKYRAKPVVIDNIRFHSTAEGNRYLELKTLQRAGLIQGLELQPRFPLHAYKDGKYVGEYRADFAYWSNNGPFTNSAHPVRRIVEDVKGVITPFSKWKIRHAEAEYNFKVQIIRMGRHMGAGWPWVQNEIEQAIELTGQGLGTREIGQILHRSPYSVRSILRRFGVKSDRTLQAIRREQRKRGEA